MVVLRIFIDRRRCQSKLAFITCILGSLAFFFATLPCSRQVFMVCCGTASGRATLLGRGLHLAAAAASQPVGMLSRPGHAPLAILQPLLMLSDVGRREA